MDDGSDQLIRKAHALERVPAFRGVATLSYCPRCLFLVAMDRFAAVGLSFIVRIWCTAPRSVCVMYSTVDERSVGGLVSIRWDFDELETFEELAAFADRIRVRSRDRLAGFSAEWQARIENHASQITGSPALCRRLRSWTRLPPMRQGSGRERW